MVRDVPGASLVEVPRPSSLLIPPSVEYRDSLGCSGMLEVTPVRDRVVARGPLYEKGGGGRASRLMNESFVPAVAGWGVVVKGFGLITGASEGCGGGVAR